MRIAHPYLAYVTYRFHVEKAREGGFRVEDTYVNKFYKEPYVLHHVYAQYFHPQTLTDRVREVAFYRRPRTLFKGFRVPDWAQAQNFDGWDMDRYSRNAWNEAMHEFNSEWTPTQFAGERVEPNIIQWFRLEQWGKGSSARFFYNEVPKPRWDRHGGHLDDVEKHIYSFTHGDQPEPIVLGIDTSTEEGKEAFKREWDAIAEMCPELLSKDDIVYPHEHKKYVPDEAHFNRIWDHYREHVFRLSFAQLVDEGAITREEADTFADFCDPNSPNINLLLLSTHGFGA
jgi:hypothetical protein